MTGRVCRVCGSPDRQITQHQLEKSYQQNEKGPCFFISLPPHFYRKSAVAGSFKR
jgi:hypothetical protein